MSHNVKMITEYLDCIFSSCYESDLKIVSDIHKSYKMVVRELQELMQLCETYSFRQTSVNVPEDAMCSIVSRTDVGFMAD